MDEYPEIGYYYKRFKQNKEEYISDRKKRLMSQVITQNFQTQKRHFWIWGSSITGKSVYIKKLLRPLSPHDLFFGNGDWQFYK